MEWQHSDLTGNIIGLAINVHRALGPGLLESAYEECLSHDLLEAGFEVRRQVGVPIEYKDVRLECGYRIDLLVENKVIVELKSIEALAPVHTAQILTYMRFAGVHIGLLMNFNTVSLRQGLKRFVL